MKDGANKWQEVDQQIKETFATQIRQVSASERLKWKIDKEIRNSKYMEGVKMKKWSIKKKIGLAIAVAVLASTACFAGGQVHSIISTGHPEWMRLKYEDIEKAEKDLGFDIPAVKEFRNGYTFKDLDINNNEALDIDNNVIGKFKEAEIQYVKENEPSVSLYVEKEGNSSNSRKANETKQCGEVKISYYLTHYKSVPENYELTEEDKANMEKEDYEIGYGSDAVEEHEIHSVGWEMNGLEYSLMVFDTEMSTEELFNMAQEVIEAK